MVKKNISYSLIVVLGLLVVVWLWPEPAMSDTLDAWGAIAESISCSYSGSAVSFGTLTTGSVSTASPTLQATSSTNTGFYWKVYDSGDTSNPGLYNSTGTPTDIIGSADSSFGDTASLSAGVEGYGIAVATTTTGSGGTLTVKARYANKTGNAVGGLELQGSEVTMASSSAAVTTRELNITLKAAIAGSNSPGDYKDTLTFTCTSTP